MSKYALEQNVVEGGRKGTRRIEIEDGMWVVPHAGRSSRREAHWEDDGDESVTTLEERTEHDYVIVGPEPVRHVLSRDGKRDAWHGGEYSYRSSSNALVGERPFGVILDETVNGLPSSGRVFVCSRQIHKGELGHRPQIARPQFAREAPVSDAIESHVTGRPIKPRDRRRGHVGWARLADVVGLIGMGAEDLIRRYIRFAHAELSILDARFAERREEIHMQPPRSPERFSAHLLDAFFSRDLDTAWIRKGFACTVLYLHHFGHVPELSNQTVPQTTAA